MVGPPGVIGRVACSQKCMAYVLPGPRRGGQITASLLSGPKGPECRRHLSQLPYCPNIMHIKDATEAAPRVIMKIPVQPSESLGPPEPGYGRAVEGNCVVVRRGGEQLEADLRSQTLVNPIRLWQGTSLRGIGEVWSASCESHAWDLPESVQCDPCLSGWGENAGKGWCLNGETCVGRSVARQPYRSQSRHMSDEVC